MLGRSTLRRLPLAPVLILVATSLGAAEPPTVPPPATPPALTAEAPLAPMTDPAAFAHLLDRLYGEAGDDPAAHGEAPAKPPRLTGAAAAVATAAKAEPLFTQAAARQQAGDAAGAREALHQLLVLPHLDSRRALRAWKSLRDLGETPETTVAGQVLGVDRRARLRGRGRARHPRRGRLRRRGPGARGEQWLLPLRSPVAVPHARFRQAPGHRGPAVPRRPSPGGEPGAAGKGPDPLRPPHPGRRPRPRSGPARSGVRSRRTPSPLRRRPAAPGRPPPGVRTAGERPEARSSSPPSHRMRGMSLARPPPPSSGLFGPRSPMARGRRCSGLPARRSRAGRGGSASTSWSTPTSIPWAGTLPRRTSSRAPTGWRRTASR